MTNKRKRIMRTFKLNEISAVDQPAQTPAGIVIMKRDDGAPVEKITGLSDVLTSSEEGHQHGIQIEQYGDEEPHLRVTYASGPGGDGHNHDLMRDATGNLILSENEGHTHELSADQIQMALLNLMLGKVQEPSEKSGASAEEIGNQPTEKDIMAEKNAGGLSVEIKKRDDQIATLHAVVGLNAEHRSFYDGLPVSKQEDFLTSSDADKDYAIEQIEKSNPVVHTDSKGREYRKNDDPRLVEMAKERDVDAELMAKFKVEGEQAQFSKMADDMLDLIPGERVEKIAICRQVSKIEDEDVKKAAFSILEGANKVYKMAMTTVGRADSVAPANMAKGSPADLLKTAVEQCAKEDNISEAKAYEKVLGTAGGQSLYDAARQSRINGGN